MTYGAVLLISTCIIVIIWTITDSEGIMEMPWRAECLVVREQGKQWMRRDRVRRAEEGKQQDQLHEKGVYGTNTSMTIPYNYAPRATRDAGDVGTVCLKWGIVLHEGITGHPLNTFLAISFQYDKSVNKSKCWVCSQLPHLSKHGLPLSAVPFSGEDICGCLDRRQANPVLSRIGGTGGEVSARVREITLGET